MYFDLRNILHKRDTDSEIIQWRNPGTDDEDAIWASLNSRLELPTLVDGRRRHHHRSVTSGSLTTVSLPLKSPVRSRAPSVRVGLSGNPEEFSAGRASSKTSLDTSNIRKALQHLNSLSSSSGSSQGRTGI